MSRWVRIVGLVGLGVHRTIARFRSGDQKRLLLSITGVAIAIGLLVVVTGTSLGLAAETTIQSPDVDYWIVPESDSVSTMAVSVGGPEFGDAHPTAERIARMEGVEAATPVSMRVTRMHATGTNTSEYVLVIGVVGHEEIDVGGLPAGALTPGDPYFASGSYDGAWTGDLVASRAAADILGVQNGEAVTARGAAVSESFEVVSVVDSGVDSGAGGLPVVLVHLGELQALAGEPPRDTADQFLVQSRDAGVRDQLATVYPHSRVVERAGVNSQSVVSSELALAIALTAFIVALIIGMLFTTTALGLEVTADRASLVVLDAVGFSPRSTTVLVATQTVTVTAIGGLLGVGLGAVGIRAVNLLTVRYVTTTQLAVFHPGFLGYGIGVATLIGLLSAPYLAWIARRTTTNEHRAI